MQPALELTIIGTNTHFAFKIATPDDVQVYSFRVLADLIRRIRSCVDDAVADRTARAKPRGEFGNLDWFFLYTLNYGTLAQINEGLTATYAFKTVPESATVVRTALEDFEQRLLQEPDVDEPCFHCQYYSMKKTRPAPEQKT